MFHIFRNTSKNKMDEIKILKISQKKEKRKKKKFVNMFC